MAKKNTRVAGRTSSTTKPANTLPQGKNYLFIVGIDAYTHLPRLYNAVKDAQDVCKELTSRYQFSDDPQQCFTLFNEAATQKNIFAKLDQLAETLTPQDNLLLYFSGHGEYKKTIDEGFWIPCDGEVGNIGSYIPFSVLTRYIKAIAAFHTFVIADSCYAGSLFTERRLADVNAYLESIPSRWLLTAGRNEVVSDGAPGDNSPFADAVLYRLRNNQEERLRVSEFCNYIILDVGNNARQVPRGAPLHGVGDRGGEFMFRLKAVADKVYADNQLPAPKTKRTRTRKVKTDAPVETTSAPADLPALRKRLKALLVENEFTKIFKLLEEVLNPTAGVASTRIALQGQYNSIRKQQLQGIVSDDFATRTINRIRVALTDLADQLDPEDLNPAAAAVVPQSTSTPTTATTLSDLERQGLQKQLDLLVQKLNFLREQSAIVSDAAQRFTLKMQIEETEKQIEEVKNKLTK